LARKAREANEKYAAVFASNPAACAISRGIDGAILEVNEAWVRSAMRSREFAIGRSAMELGLWASLEDRAQLLARLDAEGAVREHRTRFARPDGASIDVLLSIARLKLGRRNCVAWTWAEVAGRESDASEKQSAAE